MSEKVGTVLTPKAQLRTFFTPLKTLASIIQSRLRLRKGIY